MLSMYCAHSLPVSGRGYRDKREQARETHADDLVVLLVRLADDALGARVVEEAVVRERGHPGADAVRPAVRVRADEHVQAWCSEECSSANSSCERNEAKTTHHGHSLAQCLPA